jgi:hypothetical protein
MPSDDHVASFVIDVLPDAAAADYLAPFLLASELCWFSVKSAT